MSTCKLDSVFEANLGAKLAVIEELRAQLGKEGIQCPGVLVVGAQSAGKSSVLERLTGISFPRGENLCTRFPTIVHLQTNKERDDPVGYVSIDPEFTNSPALKTMEKINESIVSCSNIHMADGTKIGDRPIHIRYIRPAGPVMTLIDLPGITHVDTTDEHFDIHSVTAGMVESYVKNENMVVLVVIPANDDFGNSEALRIAQRYDKEGRRTIGVVSKCDLVPNTSDMVQKIRMVRDSDVKLSLGFIAVRNRGPEESSVDIVREEKKLFSTHPILQKLTDDEWGYDNLSQKIVELQSSRVNKFIPEVRKLIRDKMKEAQKSLSQLGNCPKTPTECQVVLTSILLDMNQEIEHLIKAESDDPSINIAARTMQYAEEFANGIREKVPDVLGRQFRDRLVKMMKEASGYTLPNFIGDPIFRRQIHDIFFEENVPEKLETLINDVGEMMVGVFKKAIDPSSQLLPFTKLSEHLHEECVKLVEDTKPIALKITQAIVDAEKVQIFTQNEKYLYWIHEARKSIDKQSKKKVEEDHIQQLINDKRINKTVHVKNPTREKYHKQFISDSFISDSSEAKDKDLIVQTAVDMQVAMYVYADIVMKRLFDTIPMVVRSVMVYNLHDQVMVKMHGIYATDREKLPQLFHEESENQRERKKYQASLESITEAQKKIISLF